jgi:FkbH-like protein
MNSGATGLKISIGVIADFTANNFVRLVEKQSSPLSASVNVAPFGQAIPTLLQSSSEFWNRSYDLVVLWTFPGSVVPRFNNVMNFEDWSPDDLDHDVDDFVDLVCRLNDRVPNVFLPSWVAPAVGGHRPSIEMKSRTGTSAALLRMNLRLVERLEKRPGIVLFDSERWLRHGGPNGFNDKMWYLSKTPFSKIVFEEAARDMVATLRGLQGLQKKVVILDLDNTLWGGILGDVGWETVQLGGHDPIGEAYQQFQKELRTLSKQGVLLAIVSKNDEATALEAMEMNAEMVLRSRDFAAWRINWEDKAQNVVDVMADLNLGLDSAVFIDDNPHERSRIRQALPDVLVPEWPSDPMDYAKTLRELRCFESPSFTREDRARTAMYTSDRQRKELQGELDSIEKWLELLDLEVSVEQLSASNVDRTAQLLNKTNQMNLTTRRMSRQELVVWTSDQNHQMWTFRLKDKVGDYGLCGVASVVINGSQAQLVDFVLSCRAMGRGVEETIISVVAKKVREAGVDSLTASYVETTKNKPCIRWMEQQRLFSRQNDGRTFVLDLNREISSPTYIRVTTT